MISLIWRVNIPVITYKRLKDDDNALALYYVDKDISLRFEIDADLYGKLPKLYYNDLHKTLVTSRTMTLHNLIANSGEKLGKNRFTAFIDGNRFNLRRKNLQVLNKNEYIACGDITYLIIRSMKRDEEFKIKIDTAIAHLIKKHQWYIAGHNRYVYTTITGSKLDFSLHQIVVSMFEELNPKLLIDHIDRDIYNNLYSNLRQVNRSTNSTNCNYKPRYTGAIVGVMRHRGSWVAYSPCPVNIGKQRSEKFRIDMYGEEQAKKLAIQKRKEWEVELNITSIVITS